MLVHIGGKLPIEKYTNYTQAKYAGRRKGIK